MASRKNFEVVNGDALRNVLLAAEEVASESVLRQAAVAGARVIHAEVQLRAPVATVLFEGRKRKHPPGFLRKNIIIAYDDDESVPGKLASYLVTWTKEAYYGRFVEFGTSNMAAQPFLRPGFEAKKRAAAAAVDEVIQRKAKELMSGNR
ncbi:hypothetical protein D9X30_3483 [Cupriavidus sp. U2]|uniref:HK97-gp10 family putative phage morphogenesis protein n=1 Tax=Cupriavidus sp. U2 TaxID=2920269 RepID=UPI00129DF61E|nr:HK97-gp10 family putative phage morphogenesis protein [Cupriavidus sp. U2]KAI3591658.1 hypothetical protein D9X30_3483 [Cupriavidus sp. U2]